MLIKCCRKARHGGEDQEAEREMRARKLAMVAGKCRQGRSGGACWRLLLEEVAGGSCWRKLLEAVAVIQEVAAVILAAVGLEMIFESFLRTL